MAIDCISLDVGEWEPEGSGECGARVWCPDLQHEGQWHHLVLVLNRAVLKNSSFSLYLDGKFFSFMYYMAVFDIIRYDVRFIDLPILQRIFNFKQETPNLTALNRYKISYNYRMYI